MDNKVGNPIFIFSLPRAGSTLLQRILMSHPEVASVAEPWLLLPLFYTMKANGTVSEFSHRTCQVAYKDFIANLPGKQNAYNRSLRKFILSLYSMQCKNDERYFLDKTPRYYFIIPELAEIFPDAKFIFLFRNLRDVYSSIIRTWGNGNFHKLYENYVDLMEGPGLLSKGYELLADKSYALKYEDFVQNPERYLRDICDYLEIKYSGTLLDDFNKQDTRGRLGDPTGIKQYAKISKTPLNQWEITFNTFFKKRILYRYAKSINESIYAAQGYSKEKILKEIDKLQIMGLGIFDLLQWIMSMLIIKLKLNFFLSKNMRWTHKKYLS